MKDAIIQRLNQANGRLKAGNIKVQISLRGSSLSLQATLPPKPTSPKQYPHQQRLYLGIPATLDGISLAEKEARKLRAKLDAGEFVWNTPTPVEKEPSLEEWITRFEGEYFSRRPKNPQTLTTWKGDYIKSFNKIQGGKLTSQAIREAVLTTEPNTRNRRRVVMALAALAKFAGVEVNIKDLAGKYSSRAVSPRDLPTDRVIVEWREKIKDPGWQWVYSVIATYGLRPHEAFHIQEFDNGIVEIGEHTKTGSRLVWPFHPEWFDEWNLAIIQRPRISGPTNSALGDRAAKYFYRLGLPFKLYDLRHCWARRTLEYGLDAALASQQMGHSLQVHHTTYHAWLGRETHQRAFELLTKKQGRPQPPQQV